MIRLNTRIPYSRLGNYRPAWDLRLLFKVLVVVLVVVVLRALFMQPVQQYLREGRSCFQHSASFVENSIAFFPDIVRAERQPTPSKTIFFTETSCCGDGFVRLNARQSCAIESAARTNPDWDIFVLFASPRGLWNDTGIPTPPFVELLQAYPNVHLRNIDFGTYGRGTPAEEWLLENHLFRSRFLHEHVADFLRLLTLYRYGGVYMDLDTVVMKSLDNLTMNYAATEDYEIIGNAVLSFAHDGFGHILAELYVREFMATFNGEDWIHNGPKLITRVLQRLCQVEQPVNMTRERCRGFHIYAPETFYPLPFPKWLDYFEPGALDETLRTTNNSYIVHVWNDVSKHVKIKVGSPTAYGMIADQKCPRSYRASGEYF